MDNYILENYELKLSDNRDSTCSVSMNLITGEAYRKERRKLYIITTATEVLYIGEANSSIKIRFQRGCYSFNYYIKNGEALRGYKGYKWLDKKENLERNLKVIVAVFSSTFDSDKRGDFVEAVEGELVYLIRNRLKYWPKFQNEIHFMNQKGAKEIAEEIFLKIEVALSEPIKSKKVQPKGYNRRRR